MSDTERRCEGEWGQGMGLGYVWCEKRARSALVGLETVLKKKKDLQLRVKRVLP